MATTSIYPKNEKQFCFLFIFITYISKLIICTLAQTNDVYIIHMDPSAMPKAFSTKGSWYMASLESISTPDPRLINPNLGRLVPSSKLIYVYNHVVDGFSASLSLSELNSLESSPGFISATRDLPVKLDTSHSYEFIGLSPDSGAWPAANFGQGVIVGVVDTGVWPESKSFSDDGMDVIPSKWKGECETGQQFSSSLCNKKLIGARFFNRGLTAHNPNVTISMNSTRDTEGHGTHTSSTAAGNYVDGASFFEYAPGTTRGMAPRAHVAMYKVGWAEGTYASDIIAAIDQAVEDRVDVISLSLGITGLPLYHDPVAIATFGAIAKGVIVSTSAGNEGPKDGSIHNGTPWVLTVAAGSLDREFHAMLTLGNGIYITGQSLYPGNYPKEPVPMVFLDSCNNLTQIKRVRKKLVVCEDRNGSLGDLFYNVAATNATGGIFITNYIYLTLFLKSPFPAIFVNPKDGEKIKEFVKQSRTEPKAKMEFKKTVLGAKPAPKAASFSSRGPSPSCPFVLKPDVMAPGDLILASWPDNLTVIGSRPELLNKFNLISGTSMSTPHVAGVAALLRSVHPDWSPAAVRSAIMTTSDITDNTGRPILDIGYGDGVSMASPLAMGSGHINPNKALNPGLVYNATTEDYINLICALNFTQKQIKTITGSSSDCSSRSLDLNYPSFIAFFNANDTKLPESSMVAKEFKRTVTNVGDGPATYTAKVTPIKGFKVSVVPEKLDFGKKYETKSYEVKVEGPRTMKEDKAFGYLTWEDSSGKHVVRSPIVVTSLSSDVLRK